MAQVSLPYTLTAGQPENVNQLMSNLDALVSSVNVINTAQIADGNVTAAKLAADSVTTAKILDANVTKAKLATDALNTFLKLATAADLKAAFGTVATPGWGSSSTYSSTVTHGLGTTPSYVFITANEIATQLPSTSAVVGSAQSLGASTFAYRLMTADGGITNNANTFYWVAIG